ncbi:MAG: hypothetical protein M9885_10615 [Burkholderiaceae bacterium]|nr:hypothetical protein [Burkholderiaceae bacterium]
MRFLARVAPVVLAAGVLAACGGGNGHREGGGHAPPPCDSQTSRGEGFAIGSCAATATNVFQPIASPVVVNGTDSYTLTLVFPPSLSALDENAVLFTAADKPPDALRNLIGVMQGQAYESPKQGSDLEPPYVAITDFHQATDYENKQPQPALQYASFGTWEKFAGSGDAAFNEGYLGIWYASRPGLVVDEAPADGSYAGRVVGIVGDGPGTPKALGGRFGFSSSIELQVSGGRITGAQLGDFTRSYQSADGALRADELALDPVVFEASSAPPGILAGAVTSLAGSEASIDSGRYEARYFGVAGDFGRELAGRFRFATSNGLIGVASFGAIRR